MVRVTLNSILPSSVPTDGWKIRYRIKGSSDPYVSVGPFNSQPIQFDTVDPAGTLYEGFIRRDCGDLESAEFAFETPCNCTDGTYQVNPGGNGCIKNETQAPSVTNSGFCLAPSINGAYGNNGARIYNLGFTNSDLFVVTGGSNANIFASMFTPGQWANPSALMNIGPMNREGVWIDSDCDGSSNSLTSGAQTTLAFVYNNPGPSKTIYLGCGGDNQFRVVVNGTEVANTGSTSSDLQFKIWHIIPVTVVQGVNYINMIATGDGSVNDSMAMVGYDNPPAVIRDATSDAELNILFRSGALRGTTYDVATCAAGWTLDTSSGSGNYICRRTLTKVCNSAS